MRVSFYDKTLHAVVDFNSPTLSASDQNNLHAGTMKNADTSKLRVLMSLTIFSR